jgi:hypothetical protein
VLSLQTTIDRSKTHYPTPIAEKQSVDCGLSLQLAARETMCSFRQESWGLKKRAASAAHVGSLPREVSTNRCAERSAFQMRHSTGAAELRPARFYEAVPKRSFSYPYGGSYLFGTYYARRLLGSPYVGSYYGSYYGPYYANLYDPYYINYYDPFLYPSSGCAGRIRPCR